MTIKVGEQLKAEDIQNLTFFPKGTILMYDGQLWDRTGGIPGWAVCNGQNGTINLTDKFIRGGAAARQTGGNDIVPVPYHTHTITDPGHTHTDQGHTHSHTHDKHEGKANMLIHITQSYTGVLSTEHVGGGDGNSGTQRGTQGTLTINAPHSTDETSGNASIQNEITSISIGSAGSATADNKPAYCTVIFIEKITAYLA
jgi:hypothetical protein